MKIPLFVLCLWSIVGLLGNHGALAVTGDYPRNPGLYGGLLGSEEETVAFIERCQADGIGALYPSISGGSAAYWKTTHTPMHPKFKSQLDAGYDALESLVRNAHAAGILVYPSVAVGPLQHPNADWETRDRLGRPSSATTTRSIAFSYPDARRQKIAEMMDLVNNYQIDGVMLDYCRYPENSKTKEQSHGFYGYDQPLIDRCLSEHGFDPRQEPIGSEKWEIFNRMRAETVTQFVREFRDAVTESGRDIRLGGFLGSDADEDRETCGRDISTWASEGLIQDVFMGMYPDRLPQMQGLVSKMRAAVGSGVLLHTSLCPFMRFIQTPSEIADATRAHLAGGSDRIWIYRQDFYEGLDLSAAMPELLSIIGVPAAEQAASHTATPPTSIFDAARAGDLDLVQSLVADGASVDDKNVIGSTPLHVAAQAGQEKVVVWLLDNGASVDSAEISAWTPLHVAAFYGQMEIAKTLLKHGANLESADHRRQTPLLAAVAGGQAEMVHFLIAQGANANALDWRGNGAESIAPNDAVRQALRSSSSAAAQ